jgi:trk system potassium uptake protein
MKILIVGAGEVGRYLCEILSEEYHDVTVIENDQALGDQVDEELNVRVIKGNGSSAEVLRQAGADQCDYFLAMTSDDKTNLISCSLAKALGAATTIARIHDQTYSDNSIINYQSHFGIDYLLNPEALAAVELAKKIRNPGRVAVENLARGQIEVQQFRVKAKARVLGKKLAELKLDPRVRIGYVQRGDEQQVANAQTILQENDYVTLFGPSQTLFDIKPLFDPDSVSETVRIVLYGGGEASIALIRLLTHPRFKIRILEENKAQCRFLAEKFPKVTVIQGDATSLRLLEEEQIGSADYFIALTKEDEDNVMTCLQASKLGAKHTMLLVNRADYIEVLERLKETLGVELVVSPRIATANEVLRYSSREPYIELAKLANDCGRIVEIKVGPKSPCVGKKLREIQWPGDCVIVAFIHKSETKVPGADDAILAGARIVAIVRKENIRNLVKMLK